MYVEMLLATVKTTCACRETGCSEHVGWCGNGAGLEGLEKYVCMCMYVCSVHEVAIAVPDGQC